MRRAAVVHELLRGDQVVRHDHRFAEGRSEGSRVRRDFFDVHGKRLGRLADVRDDDAVSDVVGRRQQDEGDASDQVGDGRAYGERERQRDRAERDDGVRQRHAPVDQQKAREEETPAHDRGFDEEAVDAAEGVDRRRQERPLAVHSQQRFHDVVFADLRQRRRKQLVERRHVLAVPRLGALLLQLLLAPLLLRRLPLQPGSR
mmetsp:Transcript_20616/g.63741  ORF Transcript_20616/g.63741 Transcript_20616/m.63741 type:complete len:202 (+) Transcript_20616:2317-2922(+)